MLKLVVHKESLRLSKVKTPRRETREGVEVWFNAALSGGAADRGGQSYGNIPVSVAQKPGWPDR
jgi:hypothetical protein